MRRRTSLSFGVSAWMLVAGAAQATPQGAAPTVPRIVRAQDAVVLPALGEHPDHATVAVNARGDVCVAWNTWVEGPGLPRTRQVEAVLLRRRDLRAWEVGAPLALGDPAASSAFVRCHKPDVVAVGEDFVVTWPRLRRSAREAVLEAAWLEVDADGRLRSLERPSPGIGWAVSDEPFAEGIAGVMPDLVALPDARAGVVYVEHDAATDTYGLSWSAFDRASLVAPAAQTRQTLVQGVEIARETNGGRLLPDVVLDESEQLAVAYEALVPGVGAHGVLEIVVERYELDPITAGLSFLESWRSGAVEAPERDVHMRRPSLAADTSDGVSRVAVAWTAFDSRPAWATLQAPGMRPFHGHLKKAHGVVTFLDGRFPRFEADDVQPARSVVVLHAELDGVFSDLHPTRERPAVAGSLIFSAFGSEQHRSYGVPGQRIERPAVATGGSRPLLALTYEAETREQRGERLHLLLVVD